MNSGQILKMIIKDKGKKQKWLATKIGMPLSTMSNLLNKDIPFSLLLKICNLLEVPFNNYYKIYKENVS